MHHRSKQLTLGSLFSGYGGLDLAVTAVLATSTRWVSDIEPGPCKILAHRYPNTPNLGDITQIDWNQVEPVDVITGGSPCQDISAAGQRRGMRPGTRSGLWESMREGIHTLNPALVVWENVTGAFNATANSLCDMEQHQGLLGNGPGEPNLRALGRVLGDLADLGYDAQWCSLRASHIGAPHHRDRVFLLAHRSDLADTMRSRIRGGDDEPSQSETGRPDSTVSVTDRGHVSPGTVTCSPTVTASDKNVEWGQYSHLIERWEHVTGNSCPPPTEINEKTGKHQLSAPFTEWMMGLPPGWITDVPGITRAEAIKACGNGVVPQQAATAIQELLEHVATELS